MADSNRGALDTSSFGWESGEKKWREKYWKEWVELPEYEWKQEGLLDEMEGIEVLEEDVEGWRTFFVRSCSKMEDLAASNSLSIILQIRLEEELSNID